MKISALGTRVQHKINKRFGTVTSFNGNDILKADLFYVVWETTNKGQRSESSQKANSIIIA